MGFSWSKLNPVKAVSNFVESAGEALSDFGDTAKSGVSDLGEMGGNIVGGVAEGVGNALQDPDFIKAALAFAGIVALGGGNFLAADGSVIGADAAAAQAGISGADLTAAMGAEGLAAPANIGGVNALAPAAAGANALAPTAAAGAGAGANSMADLSWMDTASPSQLEAAGAVPGSNGLNFTQLASFAKQYGVPLSTLASSLVGASSAQNAANTQAAAQQRANDLMYKMFQEQVGLQAPFREAGLTAQNRMLDLLGLSDRTGAAGYGSLNKPFGMEQFQADPGYAFRMNEGIKALERSRAAQVGGTPGLLSGATGKALVRYGQDLGSQEYGNAFSRYQTERANQLNPLAALTAAGQGSANVLSNAAGTYGQQAGAGITDVARAQAAGQVGTANALAGGVSQYLGYMNNQNLAEAIQADARRRSFYLRVVRIESWTMTSGQVRTR